MLNDRSFSDIFNEISSEIPAKANEEKITAGWETMLEPSHLAFLMGRISKTTTVPKSSKAAYPIRPRPDHLLTIEEISALETLRAQAPMLSNNFNLRELRTAYRTSVLKTHPDQGGTAESFQAVKKSYQILLAFVNK